MSLQEIQISCRNRLCQVRSLSNLIHSPKFEAAYTQASDDQKKRLEDLIATGQTDKILATITQILTDDLGKLTVRQLRAIAQRHGISGYVVMSKSSLLSEISQRGYCHERSTIEAERNDACVAVGAG
jgi:hypothetical protein